MFKRKQLLETIKEQVFKSNLQDRLNTFLNVKPQDLTTEMVQDNLNKLSNLEHIEGMILSSGTNNLYDLHTDLLNVDTENYDFDSLIGENLEILQNEFYSKMKEALKTATPVTLEVARLLRVQSTQAVLVGGCVRDALLGKTPKDYDFATNAHYDDVEELLSANGFKIKEAGKQFLVMIVSKDGEEFEIAMFRKDGNYTDGRRPDSVEIGTIFEDAERRDFTINSLSFNLTSGKVQDPNGTGLQDMLNRKLRFVGNADERIKEDFLRVARFYRFLGRFKELGMTPDSKSLKACRTNFAEMQKRVAPERLKNEIEKMVGL